MMKAGAIMALVAIISTVKLYVKVTVALVHVMIMMPVFWDIL